MVTMREIKLQKKIATFGIVVVIVAISFFALYYIGNGFSTNDNIFWSSDDCRIMLNSPIDGQRFHHNDDIIISGSLWGGIPEKVHVYDTRYNVPVPAIISGPNFGVTLYAAELSQGTHELAFQAQTADGRWTQPVYRTIEKYGSPSSTGFPAGTQTAAQTWSESFLPEPLALIFRPVEEVLAQTVVYINSGTAADDLNGDNIPDPLEQSPTTPRYNPMNVPMTSLIVIGIIGLIIFAVIYFVIAPYYQNKHKLKKTAMQDADIRAWQLQLRTLQNKELKNQLKRERLRTKQLTLQAKEAKKQKPTPPKRSVKIYLAPKKGGNNVQKKTIVSQPVSKPTTLQKIKQKIGGS